MGKYTWLLSLALIALMSVSGAVYADEVEGYGKHGYSSEHRQGSECETDRISDAKIRLLHAAMKTFHEQDKGLFEKAHMLRKELRNVAEDDNFDAKAYLSLHA